MISAHQSVQQHLTRMLRFNLVIEFLVISADPKPEIKYDHTPCFNLVIEFLVISANNPDTGGDDEITVSIS